jgi:hypothetical protein
VALPFVMEGREENHLYRQKPHDQDRPILSISRRSLAKTWDSTSFVVEVCEGIWLVPTHEVE